VDAPQGRSATFMGLVRGGMPTSQLVIDSKYLVQGLCSDTGGMGTLVFVTPVGARFDLSAEDVIEYCAAE